MGKALLAFVVAACVIAGGVLSYQNRAWFLRPNFSRVGGTRLICAVEESTEAVDLDSVVRVLRKRFDPTGLNGIDVNLIDEDLIEITIPDNRKHDDRVEQVKRLLDKPGKVEIALMARLGEDDTAILTADLRLREPDARTAFPPPPPTNADGSSDFSTTVPNEPKHSYRWVQLIDEAVNDLGLSESFLRSQYPLDLNVVAEALKNGTGFRTTPFPHPLFAVRKKDAISDPTYFVLVCQEDDCKSIDGTHVENVMLTYPRGSMTQMTIRLNREGRDKMARLYERYASLSHSAKGPRRLVVILDDQALFTIPVETRRTPENLEWGGLAILGDLNEDVTMLLQGGKLPARLKLKREERVKPR